MGVSFKVSRTGVRFRQTTPTPLASSPSIAICDDAQLNIGVHDAVADEMTNNAARQEDEVGRGYRDSICDRYQTVSSDYCCSDFEFSEMETSFTLNLFPEGYSIGRASQSILSSLLQEPKNLLPYDKEAKALFLAIEHGWLPGDIFDDIPCKYSNGTILCEVWDFRKCIVVQDLDSFEDGFPKSQRVQLKMSGENVVKDITLISDQSWTYSDLLNAEAQITRALQPTLCLNPNEPLDRLYRTHTAIKIDLGSCHITPAKRKQELVTFNSYYGNLSKGREIMDVTGSKKSTIGIEDKHQDVVASICQQIGPSNLANTQLDCSGKKDLHCNLSTLSEKKDLVKVNKSGFNPKTVAIKADAVLNPSPQPSNPRVTPLFRKRGKQKGQPNPRSRAKRLKKEPAQSVSDQQFAVIRPVDPENKTYALQMSTCPKGEMQSNIVHQKLKPEDMENLKLRSTKPPLLNEILSDAITKPESLVTQKFTEGTVNFEYPAKPVVGSKREDSLVNLSIVSHSPPCMNLDTSLSDEESSRKDNFSRKRRRVSMIMPSLCPVSSRVIRICRQSLGTSTIVLEDKCRPKDHNFKDLLLQEDLTLAQNESICYPNVLLVSMDSLSNSLPSEETRHTASTSDELLFSDSKVELAILQRFKMVEKITKRFGLSSARPKSIGESKKGSVSHSPRQLFDILKLQNMDDMHLVGSANSSCMRRILTFAHFRCSRAGSDGIIACNCQKTLVLSYQVEKLGQHMVEAQIIFQDEHPVYFGILHNFSQADMLASQFTSLMKREGYILLGDSIHRPLSSNCSNTSGVTGELPNFPVGEIILGNRSYWSKDAIFQAHHIGRLSTNLVKNSFTDLVMNNSRSVEQQRSMQMKKDLRQKLLGKLRQSYPNDQIMLLLSAPKMNPQQPSTNTSTQLSGSGRSMNRSTPEIYGPCGFLNEEMNLGKKKQSLVGQKPRLKGSTFFWKYFVSKRKKIRITVIRYSNVRKKKVKEPVIYCDSQSVIRFSKNQGIMKEPNIYT